MTVQELIEHFDLTVAAGRKGLNRDIRGGHCGDLLSEVMANAPTGCAWLTIQVHQNIVAVAVLKEMAAIILTGGNTPALETREKADQENIPILLGGESTYELAGRFYSAGIINDKPAQK